MNDTITLGAGCFWCVENIFNRINGVQSAISGYAGGTNENPTYEQVCSGATHHAEVVQITFDPAVVSLDTLLTVFFAIHDPTSLNKQGDDVGTQYRSTIMPHNEQQLALVQVALEKEKNATKYDRPVVTTIEPLTQFYAAEDYHQEYYDNNPENRYCQLVVAKKIQKFLATYSHLLKPE
ncbi:peptide-methionine (S)-S-oxide reductase MsrA [Thalassotalea fusca]